MYNKSAVQQIINGQNNIISVKFLSIYYISDFFPNFNQTVIYSTNFNSTNFTSINTFSRDFNIFSEYTQYITIIFDIPSRIITFSSNQENSQSFVNIITSKDYCKFNQIQYKITFILIIFKINISIFNRSITIIILINPLSINLDLQELLCNYLINISI